MTENQKSDTLQRLDLILEALKDKKGENIVTINMEKVGNAFCDYFVICHGNSTTQVDALSDSVHHRLKTEMNVRAHHIEGINNSLWILMDYSDILVHIFLEEQRSFYNLEELWGDGKMESIKDIK
ncbi:MAG: ribosome silencing factor [Bacteroidales bacterium]|nr:ribosome silencing factor [Bacteroidales bacterium]